MKTVFSSNSEVTHVWAQNNQSEGRASSVFFDDGCLYSYGHHFCSAKFIAPGTVAITTRLYSNSTARHVSEARSATRHLNQVFCYDPLATASHNREMSVCDINAKRAAAMAPRIREATRNGWEAAAQRLIAEFNTYNAALPEDKRTTPIDTTVTEAQRKAAKDAAEAAEANRKATIERNKARAAEAALTLEEALAKWRTGARGYANLGRLPCALRLSADRTRIETSRGAQIRTEHAPALWALVKRRMRSTAYTLEPMQIDHYTLTDIEADGAMIVGCHRIPFTELQAMAVALGLVTE